MANVIKGACSLWLAMGRGRRTLKQEAAALRQDAKHVRGEGRSRGIKRVPATRAAQGFSAFCVFVACAVAES